MFMCVYISYSNDKQYVQSKGAILLNIDNTLDITFKTIYEQILTQKSWNVLQDKLTTSLV